MPELHASMAPRRTSLRVASSPIALSRATRERCDRGMCEDVRHVETSVVSRDVCIMTVVGDVCGGDVMQLGEFSGCGIMADCFRADGTSPRR